MQQCRWQRLGKKITINCRVSMSLNSLWSYQWHSWDIYFSSLISTSKWYIRFSFLLKETRKRSRVLPHHHPCKHSINKASFKIWISRTSIEYTKMILHHASKERTSYFSSLSSTAIVQFRCLLADWDYHNCQNTRYRLFLIGSNTRKSNKICTKMPWILRSHCLSSWQSSRLHHRFPTFKHLCFSLHHRL